MALFGGMGRRSIDIDIVAHDKSTRVFNQVGSGMSKMALSINNGVIELNKGLHRYNSAMRGLNRITQLTLAGAGYSVYKFTKDSVNAFADFERQHAKTMGAIASKYDKTAESQARFLRDQQKLKEESIALGTVGPTGKGALYNPHEVSFAQTALAKSGKSPEEISGALPSILKFAGGNDLDIDTAATYAVNLGTMFDLPVEKWELALDKVTKTADMAAIDVSDVFNSMKYAGPIGSQMGRDLEEILTMIAILGNAGLRGSIAGTGIQSFYTKLLSPIGKSGKALETAPSDKSLQAFEKFTKDIMVDGKMKPGPEISDMLTQTMDGLNDQEQAWFAHKLFGLFQMKAGFALSKPGTGDLMQDMITEITNNSAGINDQKWEMMLDTSFGRKIALKNAVFGIKTDVGYRLSPITKAITDELFRVLSDKGNYKIDFSRLKDSISESSKLIEEQYGEQIANAVEDLANLGIDAGRVAVANEPLLEGYAGGLFKLLGGDISGAIDTMGSSIDKANDKIAELPDELQPFAEHVRDATLALMALSGINFAAKLLENITSIWRGTIGQIIKAANMNVQAGNVVLTNTGVLDKDGNPIYKKDIKPPDSKGGGTGGTGGSPLIVDAHGKPISSGETPKQSSSGSVFVDSRGNPISQPSTPKKTTGAKVKTGMKVGASAYTVGEMLGINTWMLDKLGVEGKTRKRIDRGRTIANYGITASVIDSMLFKGAGKKLLSEAGKGLTTGAGESVSTVLSTMGPATSAIGGAIVTAAVAMLIDGMKQQTKKEEELHKVTTSKDTYVWNDGANKGPWYNPNRIFMKPQDNFINVTEFSNNRKGKVEFILPAQPEFKWYKPSTWKNKKDHDEWQKMFEETERTREQLQSEMNTNTKTIMSSMDPLGMDVSETLMRVANIEKNPPVVNVPAPIVNVDVKVDKQGNVTTNKYIPYMGPISEAFRLGGTRMGR